MAFRSDADEADPGPGNHEIDAAIQRVAAAVLPGWIVLFGCSFGGTGADAPVQAQYALLHPHVGIALLDLSSRPVQPDAVDRLLRALGTAEFPGLFGGYPPVVQLCLPVQSLPSLGRRLDRAFDARLPIALRGGDTWVSVARQVLGPARAARGGMGHGPPAPPYDRAADPPLLMRCSGKHALAAFWGAVFLTMGGTVAILQSLGPPEGGASAYIVDPAGGSRATADGLSVAHTTAAQMGSPAGKGELGSLTPSLATLLQELTEPPPERTMKADLISSGGAIGTALELAAAGGAPTGAASSREAQPDPDFPLLPALGRAAGQAAPMQAALVILHTEAALSAARGPIPEPTAPSHASARPLVSGQVVPASPVLEQHAIVSSPPTEAARAAVGASVAPSVVVVPQTAEATRLQPDPAQGGPGRAALPPATLEALIRRGDAMVDLGDISAARRFYERAAAAGNGRAAAAAGRTYDPAFLAGIRAGIQADPEAASAWYRRAAALGEGAARKWLAQHGLQGAE